ncbi:bile acid:sodium symporter family protein [Phenylobacterium sp.]|uniref:bile acid:sodium symporter family protein n=1 Tax=Phenylobacterium sp. TaxID=1871053 RepID=UPI0027310AF2|nr:bile acid:sodium symporter family protein [Phenylobacterium sp.]MDP1599098.1 bile acid:sodium symporter family protein [Phenylobacterium sp.]MDP3592057.1 bile acid:sodium symporter family protein [Phenylobacterium sp.]
MARKLPVDPFLILMLGAIALATLAPAQGVAEPIFEGLSTAGVSLLFLLHGAALKRRDLWDGARQWRLHLVIFALTFIAFPILTYPFTFLSGRLMPADLALGFIYLGVLPSAVSSSIAFTAMARGNVPGAICSAAASNVFGLLLTPLLLAAIVGASASGAFDIGGTLREVTLELLLPFAIGQFLHPYVGDWMERHSRGLTQYDRWVIVLIVYTAFSKSVREGLWTQLPIQTLALAIGCCMALLIAVFAVAITVSRRLGFSRADEIAVVFCGSKKSLASGLPLAQVLFGGVAGLGMIVLPIMIYNQLQILAGAALARRYGDQPIQSPGSPDGAIREL